MSIARPKHRSGAWRIARPHHAGGGPPADGGSGGRGGRDPVPLWTTHLLAFLCGGIAWGTLHVLPVAAPLVALAGVIAFAVYAYRRDGA